MEKSNKIERSEVWNNIYEVLARLDLKKVEGDCLDRPSAATEIEQVVEKLLPIHNVVKSLPNEEDIKKHIDTLPYYGTCTTEYNEGFEDGVKWLKEQMAK